MSRLRILRRKKFRRRIMMRAQSTMVKMKETLSKLSKIRKRNVRRERRTRRMLKIKMKIKLTQIMQLNQPWKPRILTDLSIISWPVTTCK